MKLTIFKSKRRKTSVLEDYILRTLNDTMAIRKLLLETLDELLNSQPIYLFNISEVKTPSGLKPSLNIYRVANSRIKQSLFSIKYILPIIFVSREHVLLLSSSYKVETPRRIQVDNGYLSITYNSQS